MNTYSLNPNPIPQAPMASEQDHRMLNLLMIVAAMAVIIGMLYWWTSSNSSPASTASNSMDIKAQVATILRNSPVHVSQQEIESVAAQLANSKVTVSNVEKQAVANTLRQVK